MLLTFAVHRPGAAAAVAWSWAPEARTAPCWCHRNPEGWTFTGVNHTNKCPFYCRDELNIQLSWIVRWQLPLQASFQRGFQRCSRRLSSSFSSSEQRFLPLSALCASAELPTAYDTEVKDTQSFLLVKIGSPTAAAGLKCVLISDLASSSCFSLAFLLAFFPWVLASRALASDNISNSSIGLKEETDTLTLLLQVANIACNIKQF